MNALNRSKTPTPKFRQWAVAHGTPWEVSFPKRGALPGKRRFFASEQEAKDSITDWLKGDASVSLGKRVVDEVAYVRGLLPNGVSLTEAVRFYLQHNSGISKATLRVIADAYLLDIKRSGSAKYRETMGYAIEEAVAHFGAETLFSALTKAALIGYIKEPGTYWRRYDRKRAVRCLITKARELDAIKFNPIDGWTFEDAPKATPHTLKPETVQRILDHVLAERPELVPSFALQFFAGIRTEELCRPEENGRRPLKWEDITFGVLVRVPVEVSKVRELREIAFWPEALTHWLNAVGGKRTGTVCPVAELDDAKSKLLSDFPEFKQNDFRRTFATCAYALHGSKTADWMGHVDGRMLKRHYKGVATVEEATQFFGLKPTHVPGNIVAMTA